MRLRTGLDLRGKWRAARVTGRGYGRRWTDRQLHGRDHRDLLDLLLLLLLLHLSLLHHLLLHHALLHHSLLLLLGHLPTMHPLLSASSALGLVV